MATKKVRIIKRVGDPGSGMILAPGATVQLPETWADRYIANGSAELIEEKAAKSGKTSKTSKTGSTKD